MQIDSRQAVISNLYDFFRELPNEGVLARTAADMLTGPRDLPGCMNSLQIEVNQKGLAGWVWVPPEAEIAFLLEKTELKILYGVNTKSVKGAQISSTCWDFARELLDRLDRANFTTLWDNSSLSPIWLVG